MSYLFAMGLHTVGRLDRLDLLARMLRDRPGITVRELANELDMSMRSVFRDLSALRDRGLPVESSRGRGGGMRLQHNWGLGRVLLSREEALCALLGLAIAEKLGFPLFAAEVTRARRKLADAFPTVERRRLAPLRERIFVGQPASSAVRASYREPDSAVMRPLQSAFVETRVVTADYVRDDGAHSTRRLEPHALVINSPAWYLLARDLDRAATRTFRLDR
ncbi:MAG TPA: WYL domain-containing protein, partial [Gemmatimonadaceae bacterium]|nr:WYL domain-containing protein [Gemmatimonadaceae bacterium]